MFDEMKCHIFGYENSYIFHFVQNNLEKKKDVAKDQIHYIKELR